MECIHYIAQSKYTVGELFNYSSEPCSRWICNCLCEFEPRTNFINFKGLVSNRFMLVRWFEASIGPPYLHTVKKVNQRLNRLRHSFLRYLKLWYVLILNALHQTIYRTTFQPLTWNCGRGFMRKNPSPYQRNIRYKEYFLYKEATNLLGSNYFL